jgi:hypothetical protein
MLKQPPSKHASSSSSSSSSSLVVVGTYLPVVAMFSEDFRCRGVEDVVLFHSSTDEGGTTTAGSAGGAGDVLTLPLLVKGHTMIGSGTGVLVVVEKKKEKKKGKKKKGDTTTTTTEREETKEEQDARRTALREMLQERHDNNVSLGGKHSRGWVLLCTVVYCCVLLCTVVYCILLQFRVHELLLKGVGIQW